MMMTMTSIPTITISITMKKPSAAGIPRMRDAFLLAWRRKISSLQDWKSNLSGAVRCLQGSRSVSSPAQWNWNDVCLLHHLTA
jgi:hypothetical protein